MRTRQYLINLRIIHVCIMLATALFVYQYSQWDDALWVPISVIAIIGPFRPGLTINKARQRVLGSIAGLMLSLPLWLFIHFNYNALVIVALILIYGIAFTLLQEYTYFIMLVSIMLCVNFDYVNLFFNNEIGYLASRAMCVLTGVAICQFYEYLVFRHSYRDIAALVEKEHLDQLIVSSWQRISLAADGEKIRVSELQAVMSPLLAAQDELKILAASCRSNYSESGETLRLVEHYQDKLSSLTQWITQLGHRLLSVHAATELASARQLTDLPTGTNELSD